MSIELHSFALFVRRTTWDSTESSHFERRRTQLSHMWMGGPECVDRAPLVCPILYGGQLGTRQGLQRAVFITGGGRPFFAWVRRGGYASPGHAVRKCKPRHSSQMWTGGSERVCRTHRLTHVWTVCRSGQFGRTLAAGLTTGRPKGLRHVWNWCCLRCVPSSCHLGQYPISRKKHKGSTVWIQSSWFESHLHNNSSPTRAHCARGAR